MKKVLAVLIALSMILCIGLAACSKGEDGGSTAAPDGSIAANPDDSSSEAPDASDTAFDYDAIADDAESADGTYVIAFVTDVGQLKDKSFNQGTWEGVKRFATEHNKTYKYYLISPQAVRTRPTTTVTTP